MLFVGDDWAEDHHDVEVQDDAGRRLARRRLPEGLAGIAQLHGLLAACMPAQWADLPEGEAASFVKVGIETERGPWVAALVAAGYEVFPLNPMSVARYRERHSTSGGKSDAAGAHLLAEVVRLDRAQHRPVAGDSPEAEAVKLVARAHQSLIWDRSRHVLRLRAALLVEFFPAALEAFADLDAPDTLELLAKAPDPDTAAALSRAKIAAALARAQAYSSRSRRTIESNSCRMRSRSRPARRGAARLRALSRTAATISRTTSSGAPAAVVSAKLSTSPIFTPMRKPCPARSMSRALRWLL
jgi:hypothetical protein